MAVSEHQDRVFFWAGSGMCKTGSHSIWAKQFTNWVLSTSNHEIIIVEDASTDARSFSHCMCMISQADTGGNSCWYTATQDATCTSVRDHFFPVSCETSAVWTCRVKDSPMVCVEPGIRFFAAAPLVASNGTCIGAMCVSVKQLCIRYAASISLYQTSTNCNCVMDPSFHPKP